MILLAAAVAKELEFFRPRDDVDVLVTGVGPVEAAASVAEALARKRYDVVIGAGIAGAMAGVSDVGEGVVVCSEFMQLDLETGAPIALPGALRVEEHASSDPALVAALEQRGFKIVRGITVSRVTATARTARALAALGAQVETMEGFAVLRAAARAGVRAIEVRGISNIVGDRAESRWSLRDGIKGLEGVLKATLDLVADVEVA